MKRQRSEVERRRWNPRCHSCWLLLICTATDILRSHHGHHSTTADAIQSPHPVPPFFTNQFDRRLIGCDIVAKEDASSYVTISSLRGGDSGDDGDGETSDNDACKVEDNNVNVVPEDEKPEKMAYSLSGISRKVEESAHGDIESKSDIGIVDDTLAERNTTEIHDVHAQQVVNEEVIHAFEGEVELSIETAAADEGDAISVPDNTIIGSSSETTSPDDTDEAPYATTALPLSELSYKIQQTLYRHRKSSRRESKEETKLRDLVLERCEEYMGDIQLHVSGESKKRPRHPRKLLHFLAPKIPAIKQSPDITLRIKSAKADLDSGMAAYSIGSLACMTELYEQYFAEIAAGSDNDMDEKDEDNNSESIASNDITSDRRFEQLAECVLCGIDAKAKLRELEILERTTYDSNDSKGDGRDDRSTDVKDIDESLRVMDAAYAAYGLAILGAQDKTIGGYKPREVFSALSMHCRDMLLAQQGHLTRGKDAAPGEMEGLASDAASALWAFSCVKSITGYRSDYLFDTCCSIFLLNDKDEEVGSGGASCQVVEDDVDENASLPTEEGNVNSSAAMQYRTNITSSTETDANPNVALTLQNTLVGQLKQREVINTLWALAIHGSSDNKALHWSSESAVNAKSPESEVLADFLLERMGCILAEEISKHISDEAQFDAPEETQDDDTEEEEEDLLPPETTISSNNDHGECVVDSKTDELEAEDSDNNDEPSTTKDECRDEAGGIILRTKK